MKYIHLFNDMGCIVIKLYHMHDKGIHVALTLLCDRLDKMHDTQNYPKLCPLQ